MTTDANLVRPCWWLFRGLDAENLGPDGNRVHLVWERNDARVDVVSVCGLIGDLIIDDDDDDVVFTLDDDAYRSCLRCLRVLDALGIPEAAHNA